MVGTTRKSTDTICAEWFFKKAFQRCLVVLGTFFGMYRCTVASEISRPSLSISPLIRGAPQRGLSFAICLIKAIWSRGIFGLPASDRLLHLQYSRNPCRCHRIIVSGLMISNVLCQELKMLVRTLKKNLSDGLIRGLRDVRASISNCFLRYTISSWS